MLYRYAYVRFSQSFTFEHALQAPYLIPTYIQKRQMTYIRCTVARINFLNISVANAELDFRPIKKSSLKLNKSTQYSCKSFEVKERWGMHSDTAIVKLKAIESDLKKKNCSFLDYFFFYRSLKLAHLHLFWLRLQYSYEARFMMSTYLCIHCSQSFALEHYFIGNLFEKYINRKVIKDIFQARYLQDQLHLNISVANVKFDFKT